MALLTLVTARSITQTLAPVLVTVAEAFFIIPANIDVIWIMRNTEKVIPMSRARELALVVDEELVGDAEDAEHDALLCSERTRRRPGLVFARACCVQRTSDVPAQVLRVPRLALAPSSLRPAQVVCRPCLRGRDGARVGRRAPAPVGDRGARRQRRERRGDVREPGRQWLRGRGVGGARARRRDPASQGRPHAGSSRSRCRGPLGVPARPGRTAPVRGAATDSRVAR